LQELLKQFLAISRYITAISYQQKKQSQRFALQELLKQFLAMSRYITAISYQQKNQSQRFALASPYVTSIFLSIKKRLRYIFFCFP